MIVVLAFVVAIGGEQAVQSDADPLVALLSCRNIESDALRLACLDRETAALANSRDGGDVIVIDRAQADATRRRLFGFSLPSVGALFGDDEPERIDEVESVLASAVRGGDGRWIFRLGDGAVWRQVDGDPARFTLRPDQPVSIRRASLGSYQLVTGGSRAIRVRRQ